MALWKKQDQESLLLGQASAGETFAVGYLSLIHGGTRIHGHWQQMEFEGIQET